MNKAVVHHLSSSLDKVILVNYLHQTKISLISFSRAKWIEATPYTLKKVGTGTWLS